MLSSFRFYIFICGLLSVCAVPAFSMASVVDQSGGGPIHVEADRMESDQQSGAVIFVGNVEARQGEMLIGAERMTVNYRKEEGANGSPDQGNKGIESLAASGGVKVTRQDWIATADQLEYKSEERKVVLTGNTKVWQDNNMVSGDRVVLYLDEGKSVVEKKGDTGSGRVKAFFYPEKDKQ